MYDEVLLLNYKSTKVVETNIYTKNKAVLAYKSTDEEELLEKDIQDVYQYDCIFLNIIFFTKLLTSDKNKKIFFTISRYFIVYHIFKCRQS